MKIRRAADFSSQVWKYKPQGKADFLADKFEEECEERGVNPEHPRLEGYVVVDGKVPRFVVQTKRINGFLNLYQKFNRNEMSDAVDFALECVDGLKREDQREKKTVEIENRLKKSFEVRREPGSANLSIGLTTDSRSRMSAELDWFYCGPASKEAEWIDEACANLELRVTLSLEDALALCEDALHNAKRV